MLKRYKTRKHTCQYRSVTAVLNVEFHRGRHLPGRYRASRPVEHQHLRNFSQVQINNRTSPINRTRNYLQLDYKNGIRIRKQRGHHHFQHLET